MFSTSFRIAASGHGRAGGHGPGVGQQLAEPFDMALPTWSHLRVLEDAGIVHV